MKNPLFILAFLCLSFSSSLKAQNDYHPLSDVTDWYVETADLGGLGYYWLTHVKDTSIVGQDYMLIANPEYIDFGIHYYLREDIEARKVYRYWPDLQEESLYYDFSLEVGETMTAYQGWQFVEFTVNSIDTVMTTAGPRKRWYMQSPPFSGPNFYVLEGVGGSPLHYETPLTISDPTYYTACAYRYCELLYSGSSVCEPPEYRNEESSVEVQICDGDCFNQYCEEGTFTEVLTSSKGCDSTVYITISFLPENDPACITSTSELSDDKIAVSPNPSSGLFNLQSTSAITSYELFNHLGQKLQAKQNVNHGEVQLDLNNYADAVYFLSMEVEGRTKVIRLVKSNK